MARFPNTPQFLTTLTTAAIILCFAPAALSQEDPADSNRDGAIEQRDNNEQASRYRIPDDATSKNNRMLERILQRYPQADADKDGVLDAEETRDFLEKQREQWRERGNWRSNRIAPTFDNVKYGPDDKHHFDLYRAQTQEPAPLVVYFHGGQFITGDEASLRPFDLRGLLEAGISVASIDYRETNSDPFPGPFDDAAQAVRFIRFYAEQLHIDPTRIAGIGNDAGGNLALYLALQDDMFDPAIRKQVREGAIEDPREQLPAGRILLVDESEAPQPELPEKEDEQEEPKSDLDEKPAVLEIEKLDDLVLEELIPWDAKAIDAASTKLAAAVALHPIATFDPREWKRLGLPMNKHERLMSKYLDVRYLDPLNDPDVIELVEQVSPLNLISADDPPVLLISMYEDIPLSEDTVWTIMRHHPKQSQLIAQSLRGKRNKAIVRYKGMRNDPDIRTVDFVSEILK